MTTTRNDGALVEHAIGAHGELALRLHSGRVEVSGTDGDTASIRDLEGNDIDDRFEVERAEGRLAARPRDRALFDFGLGRRRRGSAHLAVEVPRSATVSIDTANGDIDARGLRGDQRYGTASGEITLADASGQIAVDDVSGTVRVRASGAIELSGRIVSGDLSVRGGTLRSVALASTSGDIELDTPIDGPGPFSLQTVSGDVRVSATGNLRVEARTVTGEIESELDHRARSGPGRGALVVGDGGRTLAFRSISGSLRIVGVGSAPARRDDAEAAPTAPPEPDASEPPGDDERLAVLRELEAGRIDVATATRRLAELDGATDA